MTVLGPRAKAALAADLIHGAQSSAELAAGYHISVRTVDALKHQLAGVDSQSVAEVRARLPGLFGLLGAEHGLLSLETARSDPQKSLKHAVAAKFAMESLRLAGPPPDQAGARVMNFIQHLTVQSGRVSPTVIDITPVESEGLPTSASENAPDHDATPRPA